MNTWLKTENTLVEEKDLTDEWLSLYNEVNVNKSFGTFEEFIERNGFVLIDGRLTPKETEKEINAIDEKEMSNVNGEDFTDQWRSLYNELSIEKSFGTFEEFIEQNGYSLKDGKMTRKQNYFAHAADHY